LHREGSVDKLRQYVEGVKEMFEGTLAVAPGVREFVWDMEMGYKGIVQVASPPRPTLKSAKRPSLNTEDLDF